MLSMVTVKSLTYCPPLWLNAARVTAPPVPLPAAVDVSTVMLVCPTCKLPTRVGYKLKEVKGDPVLRRIPVVVLTVSKAEEDILRAYDLHANCYITKPVDFTQFMAVVKAIENFWLTVVTLPKET